MEYINHINKYADSAAIQAALDEGTLLNPYVALDEDQGALDFNSLTPSGPTMGTWDDEGDGNYYFTVDSEAAEYFDGTEIGTTTLLDGADERNYSIQVTYAAGGVWWVKFIAGESSDPENPFEEGSPWTWSTGLQTGHSSDDEVEVGYDGDMTFHFSANALSQNPISISTINPQYPEGE